MIIKSALLASAALAAVVPLSGTGTSRLRQGLLRLLDRWRASLAAPTAEPPTIPNDKGWGLIHSDDTVQFEEWIRSDKNGLPRKDNEEPSLGSHVLIELFDCESSSLEQEDSVGRAMVDAARASEATIVTHDFHEFQPYGVSGAVIIQESHYTIHTWPEHRYAAVDLFYCGGTIYVDRAVEVLKERFKPGRIKFLVVRRGIESEVAGN
ncbi:MAG: adenosylmethionine decarboxylase [Fimbriimonadaceae bacterium]|nr:adenosylmethionine decarboxylase [Fimbriimonadaceae bacterium]